MCAQNATHSSPVNSVFLTRQAVLSVSGNATTSKKRKQVSKSIVRTEQCGDRGSQICSFIPVCCSYIVLASWQIEAEVNVPVCNRHRKEGVLCGTILLWRPGRYGRRDDAWA